ncbi:hypothetical protein DSM104299_03978 [Baekduia alba]|uniref:hypothetical protein n=1 Tax=Baekduia alba TaxID=2997333 RepID=UPI0023422350|nr:hypothetical protein [Baekduia alba]WCB95235.1 hypothetical protein DSM104299_03978 [Baekduia alba]
MSRRSLATTACVAGALLGAAVPAGVLAIPPTGPAENPGSPPAAVTIATPQVPAAGGAVRFIGAGFLTAGGAPQKVYVKIDDHGDAGIGPFTAAADGTLKGTVALDDAEAPADVADPSKDHWLRFLAGPSGKYPNNGPPRSLKAAFRVVAPAVRVVGTAALRTGSGRVAVRLRAADAAGVRGTADLRAAGVTLARGAFALADDAPHTVRLALTASGRRRLAAGGATLSARLTLTPRGRSALVANVNVKGAR